MSHQSLLYSSPQLSPSYPPYPPHPYTTYYSPQPPHSMVASTSSSPTLAESEPSLLPESHFKQSTDGVVKSWLTRVPLPLSPYPEHPTPLDFFQNQHPTPYVPTIIRRRALADPASCGLEQPVWQRHHPWISRFRAGSIILDHTVRRSHAAEIVNSGPWDTSIISELAGKFCDRVADGLDDPTIHNLALFAREVFDLFRAQLGHTPASFFENQLRQCVLSEFRAWWLHRLPSSIVQIPFNSPSPPHHPAPFLLNSALSVSTFIGNLFSFGLVSGSFVLLCLHILVDNLTVVEELRAIHSIISHANETLYERIRIKDLLCVLDTRVAQMSELSYVVAQPPVMENINALVQAIKDIVQQWAIIASTPTPSEASDAATLYSEDSPDHFEPSVPPILPPTPEQLPMAPLRELEPPSAPASSSTPPVPESSGLRAIVPVSRESATVVRQQKAPPLALKKRWADVVRS